MKMNEFVAHTDKFTIQINNKQNQLVILEKILEFTWF